MEITNISTEWGPLYRFKKCGYILPFFSFDFDYINSRIFNVFICHHINSNYNCSIIFCRSIVESMPVCHTGDPGSIPGDRVVFSDKIELLIYYCVLTNSRLIK